VAADAVTLMPNPAAAINAGIKKTLRFIFPPLEFLLKVGTLVVPGCSTGSLARTFFARWVSPASGESSHLQP
jgi:hypothetical protein